MWKPYVHLDLVRVSTDELVGHNAEACQAPGRLCYNCREPGHESTNCPQPRTTDGKQCYACGGVGELSRAVRTARADEQDMSSLIVLLPRTSVDLADSELLLDKSVTSVVDSVSHRVQLNRFIAYAQATSLEHVTEVVSEVVSEVDHEVEWPSDA